jgi:hypothetical protein
VAVLFGSGGFAAIPPESLCHCVTSPFEKGRLINSGFAAVGILKTLHKKREDDDARGPFPGKAEVLQRTSESGLS